MAILSLPIESVHRHRFQYLNTYTLVPQLTPDSLCRLLPSQLLSDRVPSLIPPVTPIAILC